MHVDSCIDEPVDVVRIRLKTTTNVQAVLSEFRSADKVLATWAMQHASLIEFEITFDDGYVVHGCHAFYKKGRLKCSFSVHIRRLLRSMGHVKQNRGFSRKIEPRYLVPI
jgi:hypothetical protein